MTSAAFVALWAAHCSPCAIFALITESGVQYVFLPYLHEHCDDCGLMH